MIDNKTPVYVESGSEKQVDTLEASFNLVIISVSGGTGLALISLFWFLGAFIAAKDTIGEISYILSMATILAGIAQLGFGMSKMTLIPKSGYHEISKQIDAIGLMSFLVMSIAVGFILADVVLFCTIMISQIVFGLVTSDFLANRKYKILAASIIICRVGQLIAGIGTLALGLLPSFVSLSFSLPLMLLAPVFFKSSIDGLIKKQFNLVRKSWILISHLSGISILKTVSTYLDKIIVGFFFGFTALGDYQFVFQVFIILQFFPATVLSYLVPEKSAGSYGKSLTWIPLIGAILISIAALIGSGPGLLLILPDYVTAIPVIQILSLTVVPATIASIHSATLMTSEKTKYLLLAYVVSTVVQYGTIISAIPILGLIGVGFGLFIGQVALSTMVFVFRDR